MAETDKNLPGWAADRLGIPNWGKFLLWILGLQFLAALGFFWRMDSHLTQLDTKLEVIPLQISRDLLSQAKLDTSLHREKRAIQGTAAATALISQIAIKKLPAKEDYFLESVSDLNALDALSKNPELVSEVHTSRIVLANYKSDLEPRPNLPGPRVEVDTSHTLTVQAKTADRNTLPGSVLIAAPGVSSDFEFIGAPIIRRLADNFRIDGVGFMSGAQTLDGFHWNNVAFVNTVIRYQGGITKCPLHRLHFSTNRESSRRQSGDIRYA